MLNQTHFACSEIKWYHFITIHHQWSSLHYTSLHQFYLPFDVEVFKLSSTHIDDVCMTRFFSPIRSLSQEKPAISISCKENLRPLNCSFFSLLSFVSRPENHEPPKGWFQDELGGPVQTSDTLYNCTWHGHYMSRRYSPSQHVLAHGKMLKHSALN